MENQYNNINHIQYRACLAICKANLQYVIRLARNGKSPLSIIDGGADTHVLGMAWLPLFTKHANTPKADIIGFDDKDGRKHNLPIGPHATKVRDRNNRLIILRVQHGISNNTAKHTLLCTFQMRERGIIVDDVHLNHHKSNSGEKGTQSIEFKDGTIIDLFCKSALMTFDIEKPTWNEVHGGKLPIYDISVENRNLSNIMMTS